MALECSNVAWSYIRIVRNRIVLYEISIMFFVKCVILYRNMKWETNVKCKHNITCGSKKDYNLWCFSMLATWDFNNITCASHLRLIT